MRTSHTRFQPIATLVAASVAALTAFALASCGGHYAYSGADRVAYAPREPAEIEKLQVVNGEKFADMYFRHYGVNPTIDTAEEPLSTFSVDVDTASYHMARSYLERGSLPQEAAVRVEEFVNSFDYGYEAPTGHDAAFAAQAEVFPSPHRAGYHVLHVGLKGKEIAADERKPANLVFVIDVSGSMNMDNRLGLVKRALRLLVNELTADDQVAIVVYGSSARAVLEPTSGHDKRRIMAAIDDLQAEGSTNAAAGLELGYALAATGAGPGVISRVILCSDGVANTGITSAEAINRRIKKAAERGVKISTIGFGMGNYNDVLMEKLAQLGDGNYAYVDRLASARRVFVENLTGTLQVIAKDVKIQLAFDPARVSRYRLLGYENRRLDARDFADDRVDAGEIGAGHSVTAIYEVKFKDGAPAQPGEWASLRIRYKHPEGGASMLVERGLPTDIIRRSIKDATDPTRLSLVAAAFAEKLRGSYWVRNLSWDSVIELLDSIGPRVRRRADVVELAGLIKRARDLDTRGDKFEDDIPLAEMDFDHVPVLR